MSSVFWYLVQFKPNSHRLAVRNLERQGIRTFLPMQKSTKRVSGKFLPTEKPLFPGYLFVELDPDAGIWRSVNSTIGVSRLVSFDGKPRALPATMVEALQARCDDAGLLLPPAELAPGDQVRLQSGPFAEFIATVERIDDKQRVWLLLDFMGKSTRVQANRTQIAAA